MPRGVPAGDPNTPPRRLILRDFPGYRSNQDPHDLTPGMAMSQINAMSMRIGELRVRPGYRVVYFEE